MIARGHKITVEDMSAIQQDPTDVIAREFAPIMLEIANRQKLDKDQTLKLAKISQILKDWNGHFTADSHQATLYSFTMMHFLDSLLTDFFPPGDMDRLKTTDNYNFLDFLERMLI